MYELALFAGAGGGLLASKLLGWRTILAVEVEPYKVDVLAARQNDGAVDLFPVWDDVRTFSAHNPETVDAFVLAYKVRHRLVISGGFPCTDISVSGSGIGIDGEASGLWVEMARVVSEIRPAFAFVENSPALAVRGLNRILSDFAKMGYDVKWGVIGARDCGAPHQRDRMWIVARRRFAAYTDEVGPEKHGHFSTSPAFISSEIITDGDRERLEELRRSSTEEEKLRILGRCGWWRTEPRVDRVVNGLAHRVDRVAATGDGQVPEVARTAWEILSKPELIER